MDGDRSQGKLSSLLSGGKWPPTCFYILRFFSRGIDKAMPVLQLLFYVKRIRSRSLQSGSTVYKWQKYQSGRPFSQKKQRWQFAVLSMFLLILCWNLSLLFTGIHKPSYVTYASETNYKLKHFISVSQLKKLPCMLCNSLTKSERTMNIEYYSLIFYICSWVLLFALWA